MEDLDHLKEALGFVQTNFFSLDRNAAAWRLGFTLSILREGYFVRRSLLIPTRRMGKEEN